MNTTKRMKNTSLNVSSNLFLYIVSSLLSFVVRTVFIRKLSVDLLGLDGVLLNIVTMLSIVESGFSSAVCFKLYNNWPFLWFLISCLFLIFYFILIISFH